MSMARCPECGLIFDTDYMLEINKKEECICDNCAEHEEDL